MKSKDLFAPARSARLAIALGLMVAALGGPAFAGAGVRTPEIDAGSMTAALALLSGAALVLTNRFRRK